MSGGNRLALVLSLGLALSACASGGATDGDTAPANGGVDLPEREYAPGTEPSSNRATRSAQVYLDQAERAEHEDEARQDYTDALAQAQESIRMEPNNPLGYYQAGVAYLGLGDLEQAGAMLDRAEEIYPRYAEDTRVLRQRAWINTYNEAVTALQDGNEEAAIELMQQADMIYQGRPEARMNLAIIYTNRGEYDQAIEWYQRALEVLQGPEVQYLDPETRAEWAERESTAMFNLAEVLRRADRTDEAVALYRDFIADNPDNATAKVQLGLLLLQTDGDQAEAQRLFEQALESPDLTPDEYYRVGVGLFNAGRFERAASAFEQAVAANPHFRDALFNLSQALLARSNALEDTSPDEYVAVNERLAAVTEQLLELDPYFQPGLATLAGAYRVLADETTGATSEEWRSQLLSLLERYEALPFSISDVTLTQTGAGSITLTGQLRNLNMTAGETVQLEFSLLNASGTPVATEQVSIEAPSNDQTTNFRAEFSVEGEIAGWRYERL